MLPLRLLRAEVVVLAYIIQMTGIYFQANMRLKFLAGKGATIRILGGVLEFFGNKYFCGQMGKICKWPQGMVETAYPEVKNMKLVKSPLWNK